MRNCPSDSGYLASSVGIRKIADNFVNRYWPGRNFISAMSRGARRVRRRSSHPRGRLGGRIGSCRAVQVDVVRVVQLRAAGSASCARHRRLRQHPARDSVLVPRGERHQEVDARRVPEGRRKRAKPNDFSCLEAAVFGARERARGVLRPVGDVSGERRGSRTPASTTPCPGRPQRSHSIVTISSLKSLASQCYSGSIAPLGAAEPVRHAANRLRFEGYAQLRGCVTTSSAMPPESPACASPGPELDFDSKLS